MMRLAFRPALELLEFTRTEELGMSRPGFAPMFAEHPEHTPLERYGLLLLVRHVLHEHFHPVLGVARRLQVRLARDAAVLRVVVGALQIIERRRERQRGKSRRAVELQANARRHAAAPYIPQRAH